MLSTRNTRAPSGRAALKGRHAPQATKALPLLPPPLRGDVGQESDAPIVLQGGARVRSARFEGSAQPSQHGTAGGRRQARASSLVLSQPRGGATVSLLPPPPLLTFPTRPASQAAEERGAVGAGHYT